jgi:antitoxin CcdA
VEKAKQLGLNVSQACEAGLSDAVRREDARQWEEENRSAIEGWNRWTAKNGLPLAKYRGF